MIELESSPDPLRWTLRVTPPICAGSVGDPFLFGGSGLAALISAMARSTGRPPVWATAQYLSYVRPGTTVDIAVSIGSGGRHVAQASAALSVDGRTVIAAMGAFGRRTQAVADRWREATAAPAPEDCPRVRHRSAFEEGVEKTFELRLASGRYPVAGQVFDGRGDDGRMLLWIRPAAPAPVTAELLAIVGDFISVGISHALGRYGVGNSLDNTIRFVAVEQTDWLLCDIRIEAAGAGFVHGSMSIFSRAGALMAIASTTLILRLPSEDGR